LPFLNALEDHHILPELIFADANPLQTHLGDDNAQVCGRPGKQTLGITGSCALSARL